MSRPSAIRYGMIAPIVAAVGLSACGSGAHGPAVVRVGDQAISRASVDHWTGIIERGGTAGSSLAPEKGTARRRALEFLISCQWLIGEAAMQGAPVSDHAVERALVERREANGRAEFEHQLHETGRSVDDASLEARAELAAAAIRQRLSRRADAVGDAQVASFHAHNLRLFRRREVRKVELIENLRSRSAAEALVRRIGSGEAFSKRAYHEELAENTDLSPGTQTKTALVKAIFAARANVVSKPMPLNHAWTVFVVRNIVTATARPLADVRGEVVEKLTALRRQRITAAFAKEYEARWRARTHCRSGYVVQRCAEYSGQMTANADPFAGG